MNCVFCGSRILEDMTVCKNCGAPVAASEAEREEPEVNNEIHITNRINRTNNNNINSSNTVINNYYGASPNTGNANIANASAFKPARKKPKNVLGILAIILSMAGPYAFIGLILAIIDFIRKKGKNRVLAIVAFVLFGLSMMLWISGAYAADAITETPIVDTINIEDAKLVIVDADELLEAIDMDASSASDSYLNQYVEVKGRKYNEHYDNTFFTLTSISNDWMYDHIDCYLSEEDFEIIDLLSPWDEVTVRGVITDVDRIYGYELVVTEIIVE